METTKCRPSRRGAPDRSTLEAHPAGNMPSSVQGPARWATIASGMHATQAATIDVRTERATNQRDARRARRNQGA